MLEDEYDDIVVSHRSRHFGNRCFGRNGFIQGGQRLQARVRRPARRGSRK